MTQAIKFRHDELGLAQRQGYKDDRKGRVLTSDIIKGQPNARLFNPNAENILTINFIWSLNQLQIYEFLYLEKFRSGQQRVILSVMNGGEVQDVIGYFGGGYKARYIGTKLLNITMPFFVETAAELPVGGFSLGFNGGFNIEFGV